MCYISEHTFMTATTCTLDLSFAAYVINSMSDALNLLLRRELIFRTQILCTWILKPSIPRLCIVVKIIFVIFHTLDDIASRNLFCRTWKFRISGTAINHIVYFAVGIQLITLFFVCLFVFFYFYNFSIAKYMNIYNTAHETVYYKDILQLC